MSLMSRIQAMRAELVLDLLSDKKGGPQFKDNQLLEAKVVKVMPQGKALLSIQGHKVDVKTHVPLTEGETLVLKATRTGNSQTLKLVEAHKPVALPPGLSEMRALGREGPFKDLKHVLDSIIPRALPSRTGQPRIPAEAAPLVSPLAKVSPPNAAGVKASQALAPQTAQAQANPPVQTLRTSPVPGAITLTLALSRLTQDQGMPPVPTQVLERLSEHLQSIDPKPGTPARPTPGAPPPSLARLVDQAQSLLDTFPKTVKGPLAQALSHPKLPVKEALYTLLTDEPAKAPPSKGFVEIRSALLKTFFPKGPPTPPAQGPAMPSPLPAAPLVPPGVNLPGLDRTGVFARLHELVETLALKPGAELSANTLKDLVNNSGLLWESKLKAFVETMDLKGKSPQTRETAARLLADDIKGLAMKMSEASDNSTRDMADTLKRFVDNLEKMQVLNKHASDEGGRFLLPLPFFSGEALKFGQLFVDLDRKTGAKAKEGDRMLRVAFLLEMSRLGHVQADFAVFRKSVGGEFLVEHASAKEEIDAALPEFEKTLKRKGFTVTRLACRVSEPGSLAHASLAERMVDPDDSAVNILI